MLIIGAAILALFVVAVLALLIASWCYSSDGQDRHLGYK